MGFTLFSKRKCSASSGDIDNKSGIMISLFGGKKRKRPSKQAAKVLGGKYLSKKAASLKTIDTSAYDATETSSEDDWKSCGSRDFLELRTKLSFEDQQKEWGQAIQDARRLPRVGSQYYSNNHMMVNEERIKRTIPALKRSLQLDALARWHAEAMATEGQVRHSDARALQANLIETTTSSTNHHYLGENVASGASIRSIHDEMVYNVANIRNMTDRRYKQMGMATALGSNGELYLCQIFSD